MGRASYLAASTWFAKHGFIVAVPTRIGYGVTGGDDIEHTGPCERKVYAPGYEASKVQTLAVPGKPCDPNQIKQLFAGYGKTARVPTLWVYSENDQYFGPKLPKSWFDAFRAQGGRGEFAAYPPFGDDGHRLFTGAPESWQPRVLEFLRANGYPKM